MSIDGPGSPEDYGFQEPVRTPEPHADTDLSITGQSYEDTAPLGPIATAGGDWLQREPSPFISASERPDDTTQDLDEVKRTDPAIPPISPSAKQLLEQTTNFDDPQYADISGDPEIDRTNVFQQPDIRVVDPESVPVTAETYHDIPLSSGEPVERIDKFTVPPIPPGKHDVIMPPVGVHDMRTHGKVLETATPAVGLAQLNHFLGGIGNQGAEIVGLREVTVDATEEWRSIAPEAYNSPHSRVLESRTAVTVTKPPEAVNPSRHEYEAVLIPRFGTPDVNTVGRVLEPPLTQEQEQLERQFLAGYEAKGYQTVGRLRIGLNMIHEERARIPNGIYDDARASDGTRTAVILRRSGPDYQV